MSIIPSTPEPTEEEIRHEAHKIWLSRNCIKPEDDWNAAIKSLMLKRSNSKKIQDCLCKVSSYPYHLTKKVIQLLLNPFTNPEDKNFNLDVVKTLISFLGVSATIAAGIVAGVSLFITYNENNERLITERFSKAVELLGNDKLEVRIGGIYALERISKDSNKDYGNAIEVLTTFVRAHSKETPKVPYKQKTSQNKKIAEKQAILTQLSVEQKQTLPPTDIQAALTVIGRRQHFLEDGIDIFLSLIDLRNTDIEVTNPILGKLQNTDQILVNLQNALSSFDKLQEVIPYLVNLQEVILNNINLQKANLNNINLQGARLDNANLQKAFLVSTNLQNASLKNANLQKAYLILDNLQKIRLDNAKLQNANLAGSNLEGASLEGVDLQKALLIFTKLQRVDLKKANLQGANLFDSKLNGASLEDANLQGADLSNADLKEAYLKNTKLKKAQYTDKNTSRETCKNIFSKLPLKNYPCPTIFPPNFDPKAEGMILKK